MSTGFAMNTVSSSDFHRAKWAFAPGSSSTSAEKLEAVGVLGAYGSDAALAILKDIFRGGDDIERQFVKEAGKALAETRNPNGLYFLCRHINDQSIEPEIRILALISVKGVVNQLVIDEVSETLRSSNPEVIRIALEVLESLICSKTDDIRTLDLTRFRFGLVSLLSDDKTPGDIYKTISEWASRYADDSFVDALIERFHSVEDGTARRMLLVLLTINSSHATEQTARLLLTNLQDDQWYYDIARALALTGNPMIQDIAHQLTSVSMLQRMCASISSKSSRRVQSKLDAARILLGKPEIFSSNDSPVACLTDLSRDTVALDRASS